MTTFQSYFNCFIGIDVCLEYKQKVDEEVFEVQGTKNHPNSQGPKKARKNVEQKVRSLFIFKFIYQEIINLLQSISCLLTLRVPFSILVSIHVYHM